MELYTMITDSPRAITKELGERLKRARLNRNMTQLEVAEKTGVSRKTVLNAEKGMSQLESFVAIMIALELTDHIYLFLPPQHISPLQLAKMYGKKRERASRSKVKAIKDEQIW